MIHKLYKAHGFRDKEVDSATMIFDEPLPRFESLGDASNMYQEQAEKICEILLNTCAQGVTDRLLAILLTKKASLFIFPQNQGE